MTLWNYTSLTDSAHYAASACHGAARRWCFAELPDPFDEMNASASIALAEEITNRLEASETAIRVCDELAEIIADKLLAAVQQRPAGVQGLLSPTRSIQHANSRRRGPSDTALECGRDDAQGWRCRTAIRAP